MSGSKVVSLANLFRLSGEASEHSPFQGEHFNAVPSPPPTQKELEVPSGISSCFTAALVGTKKSSEQASFASNAQPPDRVFARYTEDLNILKIHEAVLARLSYERRTVKDLRASLSEMTRVPSSSLSFNENRQMEISVERTRSAILSLEEDSKTKEYSLLVKEILEEYTSISSNASKGIVIVKDLNDGSTDESREVVEKRVALIERYLDISKSYIALDVIRIASCKAQCGNCGADNSQSEVDEEGLRTCECGYERGDLSSQSFYKDSLRVGPGDKNTYLNRENFHKALMRYQGKQTKKPPVRLYQQLDERCRFLGLPSGESIRALPLTENGKKAGTSNQSMLLALNETNNSAYYEDINLICHIYWGWRLPDVSRHEEKIMQDYDLTQEIYDRIPNKERTASLNVQFRLYVHLLALGLPCSKDDFKMQIHRDSLLFHQSCWNLMCVALNLRPETQQVI